MSLGIFKVTIGTTAQFLVYSGVLFWNTT